MAQVVVENEPKPEVRQYIMWFDPVPWKLIVTSDCFNIVEQLLYAIFKRSSSLFTLAI